MSPTSAPTSVARLRSSTTSSAEVAHRPSMIGGRFDVDVGVVEGGDLNRVPVRRRPPVSTPSSVANGPAWATTSGSAARSRVRRVAVGHEVGHRGIGRRRRRAAVRPGGRRPDRRPCRPRPAAARRTWRAGRAGVGPGGSPRRAPGVRGHGTSWSRSVDVSDDASVAEVDRAIGRRGDVGVVRHHHDRLAGGVLRAQQVEHQLRRHAVERTGGFVGEQQVGMVRDGAGDGDTLLLAARQRAGHRVARGRRDRAGRAARPCARERRAATPRRVAGAARRWRRRRGVG